MDCADPLFFGDLLNGRLHSFPDIIGYAHAPVFDFLLRVFLETLHGCLFLCNLAFEICARIIRQLGALNAQLIPQLFQIFANSVQFGSFCHPQISGLQRTGSSPHRT